MYDPNEKYLLKEMQTWRQLAMFELWSVFSWIFATALLKQNCWKCDSSFNWLFKILSLQYVAQFSYGPSFRTKRTLFDYFRRSFKSSSTEEFQK